MPYIDNFYNFEFMTKDVCEFLGITKEEIYSKMNKSGNTAGDFEKYFATRPITQQSLLDFYSTSTAGLLDTWTAWYNFHRDCSIVMWLRTNLKNGKILDHAGWLGNLAIACNFFGLNITYSELGKTKEFAEYRFKKYGIDMPTQFSNKIEGMFDTIISLEVFEHLYEPEEHYKELLTHLNSGGYLIFTHSSHDIGRPEHLDRNLKYSGERAIKVLEDLGLKRHQVIQYPFALYAKDDGTSNCEGGQITSLGTSVIHILRKE